MNPLSLVFREGNETIFMPQILFRLGGLEFIVPVSASISLRKKIVITEIYGADFSVKEDFGCNDFQIRVDGRIGNTDSSVAAKICAIDKKVGALDFISRLTQLFKQKNSLSISDVSQDYAGNLVNRVVRTVDSAFDFPFGGSGEPEGLLAKLGITDVVLTGLDINPLPAGHYQFHVDMVSESGDEDIFEASQINLFLEEQ